MFNLCNLVSTYSCLFSLNSQPPCSTLFPYPTLFRSLRIARQLLIEINRLGLPAGSEFLDVISPQDRKSTRLNSSHLGISYAVFCLKKKKIKYIYIYIIQM